MSEIGVLGPGGVGGFTAAALSRAGEQVTVVARKRTAEVIARDGITVRSVTLGEFVARPKAVTALRAQVDVLIVATKSTGLGAALERVVATPALVVPLLNGFEHMALLRDRFGAGRVAAGVIRVESVRSAPGKIVQTSPLLRIDLAADEPSVLPQLRRFGKTLERAGIPVLIDSSEAHVLWSKLVRLTALACTTSASGRPIGFIRSDPEWRVRLEGCIREAAAVAAADGADVDPAIPWGELQEAHPGLRSSMQRDVVAGREPELESIAGAVIRAGRRHGLECPTIAGLAAQIAARAGVPAPA